MESAPDPSSGPEHIDQRVTLHGVTWAQYEALLAMRGESSALRVTYLDGELEIMAPSTDHESLKTRLARLVEAWAEEMDLPLEGYGSWTVKLEQKKRGVEPDECYFVGGEVRTDRPDLAIEVVWTSGGIDKLDVYRALRVPEVWTWERGALTFHLLQEAEYAQVARSVLLPALDPALIVRCMSAPSQTLAVKQLRAELRAERAGG